MPAYVLTVGGTDLAPRIPPGSVALRQAAYGEVSRLTFRIDDEEGTAVVADDSEVIWTQDGTKIFAGFLRTIVRTDAGVSAQKVYDCTALDYGTLLDDDIVDAAITLPAGSSDASWISTLFSTFGTRGVVVGVEVQTVRASMASELVIPLGHTLHQALTLIAKATGASFFVDFDKRLHYFTSEATAAPFALSDAPDLVTTFPYDGLRLPSDTTDRINAAFVIWSGGTVWRYPGGTPPAAGTRRAAVINDPNIATLAEAQAQGDALLASRGDPRQPGELMTWKPGLRAGQLVQVTHAGLGLASASFRIQAIEARPQTRERVEFRVGIGSRPWTLAEYLAAVNGQARTATFAVSGGIDRAIADLSIGGGNMVRNSSFEDGSAWAVGAGWVIGFDPTSPEEPFHGTDVARLTRTATTAGDLITPDIPVADDDYQVSVWRFVRSRSAGTFRVFVQELSAASAVLATHVLDVTAVDTEWRRLRWKFGTAADPANGVLGWNAATVKIRVGANSAGANATLVADLDGVQVERGRAVTAYAPAADELLTGVVGTTQIADDAVTTPKVIANAIVAGKVAAGAIATANLQASAVTADKIAAGAVTADKVAAGQIHVSHLRAPSTNFAPNGDFEDTDGHTLDTVVGPANPLHGWQDTSLTTFRIIAAGTPKTGSRAMFSVRPGTTVEQDLRSLLVPVQGGRRIRLRAWVRGSSTNNANAAVLVALEARKSDRTTGAATGNPIILGAYTVGTNEAYAELVGTGTTSADTAFVQVLVRQVGTVGGSTDTVGFDGLELYYADDDIDTAAGSVKITAAGITIVDGKLTLTNPGGTVVIDGTSNMFKITATGTISANYAAAPSTTTTTANLGNLQIGGVDPVILFQTSLNTLSDRPPGNGSMLAVSTAGVVTYWARCRVLTIPASDTGASIAAISNTTNPGSSAQARYYALAEVGI